jgi:hypothetical protein
VRRNIHVFNRAAQQAATRRHYYQPRRQAIYRRGVVVQRVGPAFALIVPTKYLIETRPPESGLHPHGDHDGSAVVIGTEVVLLLVV